MLISERHDLSLAFQPITGRMKEGFREIGKNEISLSISQEAFDGLARLSLSLAESS